uniref:Regulatory protein zeste n=1 Tax=Diabrotica virgifera virgifera TaxID=50390 RepID=A0A6P7GQA5_DIAVI
MADINKRKQPMSMEQKNLLIEYMRAHPQLKQKFSSTYTRKDSITMWTEITNILNATPGTQKDWKDWRKGRLNSYYSRTGGGPALPDLSQSEEIVVEIIGNTAIEGMGNVRESEVAEIDINYETPEDHDLELDVTISIQGDELTQPVSLSDTPTTSSASLREKGHVEASTNSASAASSKPRNVATQRLDTAINQSSEALQLLSKKLELKTEYYKSKLELMRRDVTAKENIVSELKKVNVYQGREIV